MQLLHNITIMRLAVGKYADYSSSYEAQLKESEERVAG